MAVSQLDNIVANIVTIAPRRLDLNKLYRLHFEQVDWGLPVGAIASVGFIGAFRFFGAGERAEDFALLRSAELTLKNGFSHFAIIDERQSTDFGVVTTPSQSYTTGSVTAYGNTAYGNARTTTTGGQSYIVKKPSASNTIVCFSGKPENGFAYDAQFLYDSLTAKYGIKPGQ